MVEPGGKVKEIFMNYMQLLYQGDWQGAAEAAFFAPASVYTGELLFSLPARQHDSGLCFSLLIPMEMPDGSGGAYSLNCPEWVFNRVTVTVSSFVREQNRQIRTFSDLKRQAVQLPSVFNSYSKHGFLRL